MLNYEAKNPKSILRDALIDPSPDLKGMELAYPQIFGVPGLVENGVGSGRSIDMTPSNGRSGALTGKLLVRDKRDLLAAASRGTVAKPVGSPRDLVEGFPYKEVEFTLKQFDGMKRELIKHLENGFLMSADREIHLVQECMFATHLKLERYAAAFFTNLSNESAVRDPAPWTNVKWDDPQVGGTDLDSSTDFMEVFSSVLQDARLRSTSPITSAYMSRRVGEKLAREASVLGRAVSGDATKGLAMVNGATAMPIEHVKAVFAQFFGITDVVFSGAIHDTANPGQAQNSSYIWPDDRMWIGSAAPTTISLEGNSTKVLSGSGAFAKLIGSMDVVMAPEQKNMPAYFEAISEYICEDVCLDADKGTIIYDLA